MAFKWFAFVLILTFVNCENDSGDPGGKHLPEILEILKKVNADFPGSYRYTNVVVLNEQTKDNKKNLEVEVRGECILFDDAQCFENPLVCRSEFNLINETSEVILSENACIPKTVDQDSTTELPTTQDSLDVITSPVQLSHEIATSNSGEQFVAFRRGSDFCDGCPIDLNTNVEGLDELLETALRHVESERTTKHALVKVLRIQQQVVAGVKYILLIEIAPTLCPKDAPSSTDCSVNEDAPTETCQIEFIERPWISKEKPIISNNCTVSQKFTLPDNKYVREDRENEIDNDVQPYAQAPLNSDWLAELESQIITEKPTRTPVAVTTANKIESEKSLEENSSEEKLANSSKLVENERQVRSTTPLEKISSDEKPIVVGLAEFAASMLDNIDDDNHKRIVLQVLGAKKMKFEGTLYHLTLRIGVSRCLEDDYDEKCREKLFENLTKICKVQVHINEEQLNPRVLKSQCQTIKKDDSDINRTTHNRFRRGARVGGRQPISTDNPIISELITNTLTQLDAQSGGKGGLKVSEIISANRQVVSGSLYRIKVKLVDGSEEPKMCTFTIWDQPWLPNGRQTNVTCDDEKYTFRSKREIKQETLYYSLKQGFKQFMLTHKKLYKSKQEYNYRFKVFRDNMKYVQYLNDNELGTATYGITKFSDLTRQEFSETYLGYKPELASENEIPFPKAAIPDMDLPTEFDWRKKGVVSEVKDQGQCGSCWAFSVTGNVEGQYAIKHGKLLEFSEQELVDCDKLDDGCNGGLMDNAYRAIEKLGGLETEQNYPYDAEDERCHFNASLSRVQLSGALNISQNETDMAKWLVKNGPISIAINANAMQFYVGGVSHPLKFLCSPKSLDHGVLIVGYGVHNYPYFKKSLPFWIVKNSWGPSWGEQGYYRVYRGDGTCGVNQTPSTAIVE